jgi:hypothetical protein
MDSGLDGFCAGGFRKKRGRGYMLVWDFMHYYDRPLPLIAYLE